MQQFFEDAGLVCPALLRYSVSLTQKSAAAPLERRGISSVGWSVRRTIWAVGWIFSLALWRFLGLLPNRETLFSFSSNAFTVSMPLSRRLRGYADVQRFRAWPFELIGDAYSLWRQLHQGNERILCSRARLLSLDLCSDPFSCTAFFSLLSSTAVRSLCAAAMESGQVALGFPFGKASLLSSTASDLHFVLMHSLSS